MAGKKPKAMAPMPPVSDDDGDDSMPPALAGKTPRAPKMPKPKKKKGM